MSFKLVNLISISSLAVLLVSFSSAPLSALALAQPAARPLAARHHGAIAKRKRSTKTCKPRPTSAAPKTTPHPAATYSPPKAASTPKAAPASNNSPSDSGNSGGNGGGNSSPPPNNNPSVSVGGSGKIGMAWMDGNSQSLYNFKPANAIYTWSPSCPDKAKQAGLDCFPMNWGQKDKDQFKQISATSNAEYFMAFNEVNEVHQANMDPATAVALWRETMLPLQKQGKKIVCPVTSSNPNGLPWVQQFLKLCGDDCKCSVIPLHFYDNTIEKFKDYVNLWHKNFPDYPLWVTEFACVNFNGPNQPDPSYVAQFMREVTQWMDQQDFVERYFAFGFGAHPGGGTSDDISLMDGNGNPTALGNIYLHH